MDTALKDVQGSNHTCPSSTSQCPHCTAIANYNDNLEMQGLLPFSCLPLPP